MLKLDGTVYQCPKHKAYKAMRVPGTGCIDCMSIYRIKESYMEYMKRVGAVLEFSSWIVVDYD